MSDYQPISCALYSDYEVVIMQRKFISLHWLDANNVAHNEILQPCDLITCKGEEFLLAKSKNNEKRKIRLDRLMQDQQPQFDT